MKHKLVALGTIVLAMVAIGGRLAEAQTSDWKYACPENGTVRVTGMTEVRYGAEGACGYRYATVSSNIPCNNAYFGDPCYGTFKHCDTRPAETANGPYYAIPAWAQTLPSSTRFIVLSNMDSRAVLDKETGLVWEQSPSTRHYRWYDAQYLCNSLAIGDRKGWRLPTIQELASLVDASPTRSTPALPPGHPFSNVQSSIYWSATTVAASTSSAWALTFADGNVSFYDSGLNHYFVWCVRGGKGVDAQ